MLQLLLSLPIFLIIVFAIGREIYYSFDHGEWKAVNNPDPNAKIQLPIQSEKVHLSKHNDKLLTTLVFTDGYFYTTSRTKRRVVDGPFKSHLYTTVELSVDEKMMREIIAEAYKAHDKAVARMLRKKRKEKKQTDI